ncbi:MULTISPECIES: lysophospholipid acyltransferase family protein [Rhodanobacter]|uniref:lysophospholipid acyltransferase family protein n=1 Tax=Rhodanobacter TaxID=75309 RepID=UPI000400ACD3|nr:MULTISPECIES: lysophospholipid acyltransferase family protein [Rhodanobacter]KZC21688.1 acetyltransferase [Rhodanobacter denitrificans]UJJ51146.1 1-acyl-sn-glycerol-3-phosphate acyltransferase [Rhodanobacter denitrificans]UJM93893.1 1-acyl-sn-glycerol-3-phosphate acyltransferase [Rhodanobacter denitrificans]UJM97423.1 1-acyl-sn-glycerol-3-phosphate acyltransferase [Rhodanobacter denitrificans]UJN23161.1 1-acyl-sn-glycerol-3-phosphate acyltransferase [Rhodanobacter denitrificans]
MSIDTTTTTTGPERDLLRPLRYLWRVPLLLLHIVLGIALCALILSWNQRVVMNNGREPFAHRMIRWWSLGLLRIFGLRSVRFGEVRRDPVLFVANHTSWIDIVMLHSQRAACFVAKAEIAGWPLIGWLARNGGTIFHRRGNNHSLSTVMQAMVERLREGRSVAVFPEGGTGYNGVLKIFHARIFQAALDATVPVQPVALRFARDGRRVLDAGFREHESFVHNIVRMLGEAPLDAEVHFLAPVPATPEARRRMAELSRERIAVALEDRPG